jgi:hypothetical protein
MKIPYKNVYNFSEFAQFTKTYQSTVEFNKFLSKYLYNSNNVLDIGTGIGGTLSFYTKRYKNTHFIGIDHRKKYVNQARTIFKKLKIDENVTFERVDVLKNINDKNLNKIDGIISEKTFCTFKNIEKPIKNLIKLKPNWIGINSLFFDGYMDILIHQRQISSLNLKPLNQDNIPDGDFNIHSLKKLIHIIKPYGYKVSKYKLFFPNKKIKSNRSKFGTYTMKTEFDKNTCFSGPVHLPWYFVLIEKK